MGINDYNQIHNEGHMHDIGGHGGGGGDTFKFWTIYFVWLVDPFFA